MARNNIQFKGIRHSPSDITGQDGDLLECVNLIHENGELKPIEMPEKTYLKGVYSNETLVAVHNLTDGKKFVFAVWNTVATYIDIIDESNNVVFTKGIPQERIQWAETIGNTLIIGTDKNTYYAIYKNVSYKWLGSKLPQPVFKFDFRRTSNSEQGFWLKNWEPKTNTMTTKDNFINGGGIALRETISYGHEENYVKLANTSAENKKLFRDGIRSRVASVEHNAKMENVFIYPFFVRYAVKMFDGNYAMHSSPILMIPSSLKCPLLSYMALVLKKINGDSYIERKYDGGEYYFAATDAIDFRGMELVYDFDGFVDENGNSVNIDDWSDVINGVDIFLSSQISSYNERKWDNLSNVPDKFYCFKKKIMGTNNTYVDDDSVREYGHCYTKNKRLDWFDIFEDNGVDPFVYDTTVPEEGTQIPLYYYVFKIPLPESTENEIQEKIKNTNLFYKVKEYKLGELKHDWSQKFFRSEVEYGLLDRLETLPTLHDDYISRSNLVGKVNYNYNQRLVLGDIKLQAPLWYQDAKQFENTNYDAWLMFKIEKPEKTIWVRWEWERLGQHDFGHYLYFPDPDCKEVVLCVSGDIWRSIPMHEHTGLNGAYALMPDLQSLYEARQTFVRPQYSSLPVESTDRYYQQPNTIAMSSVANPFHFPATNFKDIGRTKVIGIAVNTLDVSYEQWGPYPLVVFCNDGIVAVTIDKEGKFTGGVDAISADVLREPVGLSQPTLIQLGQSLMFLTQRGVMMMAGTKIACVSEAMDGRHFNPMLELDGVDYRVGAFANLICRTSDDTSFRDFVKSGFLAFDYAHNRVLMLRSDMDYQYVYSLGTGLWSKQIVYNNLQSCQLSIVPSNTLPDQRGIKMIDTIPMKAAVNDYTEMYLQDNDGWLYKTMDLMEQNASKQLYQYGYFVSRPVRFGTDEYKTITRVLNRHTHFADKSFVKMALYGSRDGKDFGRINTLRGMSYQYFIFVIYTYLMPNERYSYLSVDFDTRMTNKLR